MREKPFGGWDIRLWVEPEGDWVAELVGFPDGYINAFGPTPEKALKELHIVWKMICEISEEDGKEVPRKAA